MLQWRKRESQRRGEAIGSEASMSEKPANEHPCASCPIRRKAEANPRAFLARLWRWHTTWCPGWKGYQAALAREAG
jgi:hypothetical protein